MLGIEPRAARAAWTVFLVALLLLVVYYIRKALLVFVLAVLFAYLLSPVVNLVERFSPWRRSRTYSLAVVYIALIGLLIVGGIAVGNRVAQEATDLARQFPKLTADLEEKLGQPGSVWLQPVKNYLLTEIQERFSTAVLPLFKEASRHVLAVLSSAVLIVLVPILGFFFLKDGSRILDQVLCAVSGRQREMWGEIAADLHVLLGQFIRALVVLSFATFVFYSVFFAIIGLPYGVLLATIAGALEFIPVFGPAAAAIIVVVVAGLAGTGHIILILAFLAAYRIFQDYILNPHLMSAGISLHPLLIIFGVLAGEEIAGIPGMFLSVPVLATLRVLFARIRKARERVSTPEETPITP